MSRSSTLVIVSLGLALLAIERLNLSPAYAEVVFIDTFDDGDLTNEEPVDALTGQPIIWHPFDAQAEGVKSVGKVEEGHLIATAEGSLGWVGIGTAPWGEPQLLLGDMSIRAKVRLLQGYGAVLNPVRDPVANGGRYVGIIGDGFIELRGPGRELPLLAHAMTDLNVSQEDLIVQIDSIEHDVSMWAWRDGDEMPDQPLLRYVDPLDDFIGAERGDVWIGALGSLEKPNPQARFDYVQVATSPILIDFTATVGDFDRDNVFTVADIDLLTAAIRDPKPKMKFDVNQDGSVDLGDHEHWVKEIKEALFGDANLDGEFNTGDFVQVFQAGEYDDGIANNSSWATGDWNADSEFDSADFLVAFQDGGFEQGVRAAANAVPEPSTILMTVVGLIGFAARPLRRCTSPRNSGTA